jgi:2'-5' RNA ligase
VNDGRTALVVVLPKADAALAAFRGRHDPAVTAGVPAHVTLLAPFAPLASIEAGELERLYAEEAPFDVALDRVDCFPEHVWLAPEPRRRFLDLIEATVDRFPDHPPYGGILDGHVPHVTIAAGCDPTGLVRAARDELADGLPIYDRASAVTLFEQRDERWHARGSFPFCDR